MTSPIAVITCAVLEDEVRHLAKDQPGVVHIHVLEQGLHNEPPRLRDRLQQAVALVESTTNAEAIVLGYGLCSRGIEGVRATRCKLVVARAHDCITLLLGDKNRYAQYVKDNPGTYWYSPGWNRCHIAPGPERYQKLLEQYTEKYGEEDAAFLMESEQQWFKSYNRATYVDLGVGVTDADLQYTRRCADWLGWQFDRQHGDPQLLRALLAGDWDPASFLVLPPGQTVRMTADDNIIEAGPSSPAPQIQAL
jgi:hypothetical protein